MPPLDGAFDSGTGATCVAMVILVKSVICITKPDLHSLTKKSFNVQNLENVIKLERYRVELSAILSGFCQATRTLSPDTSYPKDFLLVQHEPIL